MSDYAHRPGGSLKFKGEGEKKKKKKSHTASDRAGLESRLEERGKSREAENGHREERSRERDRDRSASPPRRKVEKEDDVEEEYVRGSGGRKLTEAEKRFEEIQRQRRQERAAKSAKMSHKERVQEFNAKLDKLTEHNDIPKISWTG